MQACRNLLRRHGEWRSDLLWRLFGLSIFQFAVLHLAFVRDWKLFSIYRLQWLLPAGVVFALGGSRPATLLVGWLLILVHFVGRLAGGAEVQLGEEFGIFLSLPVFGFIGYWVAARSTAYPNERSADDLQVTIFRVAAISTLAWATLHKVNVDFLDPTVSCGPLLSKEISGWWGLPLPALIVGATPWQILSAEGLCPLLLVIWPRAGIVWTTLVIGTIGQRGATAFAMLAVVLALSFLEHEDDRLIARGARRFWPVALALTIVLIAISAKTYIGPRPWYEFMILQVFLLLALYVGLWLLICDPPPNPLVRARWRANGSGAMAGGRAVATFVSVLWLAALLNGLAPYLGWKYRLSFAMLSNLRVDDARWNSLIFPRWLRLSHSDPFVHVDKLTMDSRAREFFDTLPRAGTRALMTGLVSPLSLEYRTRYVKFHDLNIDAELRYKGETLQFHDIAHAPEFQRWLDGLPMTLMIQDHLSSEGPQECTH